jgi:hypothetical protein
MGSTLIGLSEALHIFQVDIGGLYWRQAEPERKDILGRKECTRKATTRRKRSTHTCMEDLTILGLGFL